eukprot:scaffold314486_cov36-Prasinocladus_malaysianus.AAC.1
MLISYGIIGANIASGMESCHGHCQVFDCGLIGEGAFHIFGSIQSKLVSEDYILVPASARVFCQGIEMRTQTTAGFDVSQLNRYRWRPDYEGIELAGCRQLWKPLSNIVE